MKIAFVIYDLAMGGAEKVVSLISNELSKKNEVFVITFDNNKFYETNASIINLNIPSHPNKFIKIINIFKRIQSLKKVFKNYQFDKIFSFMDGAYIPTILTGYKVYPSIRLNPDSYWGVVSKTLNRYLLSRDNVQKIIVPSKLIHNNVEKYTNKEIKVIYNPISDFILETNINDFDKFIVTIGRLDKIKRFNLLIEVYKESDVKLPLVIIGDGSEFETLSKLINSLNLEKKVFLIGSQSQQNVMNYLYNAEFFIFMSKSESFGNVILESLSVGTPVITTNVGIVPEIIKEENGMIFKNNYVDELRLFYSIYNNFDKHKIIKSVEMFKTENISKEFLNV